MMVDPVWRCAKCDTILGDEQSAARFNDLSTQLTAALKRAEDAERNVLAMSLARQAYLSIAEKARQLNFNLEADLAAANAVIAKLREEGEWRPIESASKVTDDDLWLLVEGRVRVGGFIKNAIMNDGKDCWMLIGGRIVQPTMWRPYRKPSPPSEPTT